jgi:ABC-type transport system involved in cytochrome c biogenesis permease subunit
MDSVSILAAVFTVFAMTSKQINSPLPPVLKTFWFEFHVVLAFMSYALFGIAAVLGGIFLKEQKKDADGLAYRAVLIGYCLFTLSMIFGGIWAYLAWGTYWMWTPKELWTSILWAYYSFHLHARLRPWWAGKPMAYLGIVGFAVVMFTYLGVSLLMKSSHSF